MSTLSGANRETPYRGERRDIHDDAHPRATLAPDGDGGWRVREGGPIRLWEGVERVIDVHDAAGRPEPETFTLCVHDGGQHLRHPRMPCLPLPPP
ncbi:hypothetical protein ACWZEH_19500 [Streptomyces sp. QTS137]